MAGGFFTVHRKIADNGLFRDNHSARHLFLDLLRMAAFRETVFDWRGTPLVVQRGQLIISLQRLASETGFSVRTVRTLLAHMAAHGVIKIDTPADTLPTRITICKYEDYQGGCETTASEIDKPPTHKRNKGITKEGKKDTNKVLPSDLGSPLELELSLSSKSDDFERFWAAYPRRDGKAVAARAFAKALKRKGVTAEQLIDAATRRVSIPSTERRFIPMAATWLNGERYLDALDTTPKTQNSDKLVAMYEPLWGDPPRPTQEQPEEDLDDLRRRQADWDAVYGVKQAREKAAREAAAAKKRDEAIAAALSARAEREAAAQADRETAAKAAAQSDDDDWPVGGDHGAPRRLPARAPHQAAVDSAGQAPHAVSGMLAPAKAGQPQEAGPRRLDRQQGLPGLLHPLQLDRDGVAR